MNDKGREVTAPFLFTFIYGRELFRSGKSLDYFVKFLIMGQHFHIR